MSPFGGEKLVREWEVRKGVNGQRGRKKMGIRRYSR